MFEDAIDYCTLPRLPKELEQEMKKFQLSLAQLWIDFIDEKKAEIPPLKYRIFHSQHEVK